MREKKLTTSTVATIHTNSPSSLNKLPRHSTSFNVSITLGTINAVNEPPCTFAKSNKNILGIDVSDPLIVNACRRKVSKPGMVPTNSRIHGHSFCGPNASMEEVRTVKFWRALRGRVVGDVGLSGVLRRRWEVPERRYSVSRERRLGRTVTMVGIVEAGAPFSRRSLRRGSCERTEMRMVGGTPAHLCCQAKSNGRRGMSTHIQNMDMKRH